MTDPVHVTFVCSGNICRSPMAEIIVAAALDRAGLADAVRIDSAGTGAWHVGEPADDRARAELRRAGYDDTHTAAVLGPEHDDADLFVALDSGHRRALARRGDGDRTRLLREFDPDAHDDLDVADPYYGDADDFVLVREQVEAATPGIVDWIREEVRRRRNPGR
ncbi:MAG: low molecular weight phosphotyrosine protein phosphatase [Williamsia herbipolensis]|uniref:protein-tyrosine-phosphatase n=1 Tax=Williamsia serinedens TaxID=391736 RepID=A0ABT1H5W7_9NOCA|nr:low molecular weight protein-tyrosine-phosphatase [Williamsia serinedens]MBE7162816.1 low molecular weight phosphotyrosine protein phosphatase [Williamsia herbipolensis]MCP2162628.1 protein-tyrosine phosphatase [Williamsia serinedens]